MKLSEIVALKENPKILVRVISIDEYDWCTVELVEAPGLPLRVMFKDLVETGITEPRRELEGSVSILGTKYSIKIMSPEDRGFDLGDGYIDFSTKEIFLAEVYQDDGSVKDLAKYQRKVLRHEIIHGFFLESGLGSCSNCSNMGYGRDEELVDWFAMQSPKIFKAFEEAGCSD